MPSASPYATFFIPRDGYRLPLLRTYPIGVTHTPHIKDGSQCVYSLSAIPSA